MGASRKSYPTDLTDDQWELASRLIPPAKTGGIRRTIDMREVWKKDGTFENMNTQLSKYVRVMEDRRETPSASILDSQSVQTATMAHEEVGYDANKKRRDGSGIYW
jgi:transposase